MNQNYPIFPQSDKSGRNITEVAENGDVPKEDRKRRVLEFLADAHMALPRKVIYRNLAYRGATFSESSVKNYLGELREEGFIERVDPEEFAEGKLIPSDSRSGYYVITQKGRQRVDRLRESRDDDLD